MAMTTQTHKLPGCLLDVQWMHHVQSKLEQQKSAYVFFWLACGPFFFWFLFPARTCVSCWRSGRWNPGVDGCCALKVAPRLEEFDGSRSVAALLEEAALEESIPREVLREKFRNYDIILYIHMIIIYCEHMFFWGCCSCCGVILCSSCHTTWPLEGLWHNRRCSWRWAWSLDVWKERVPGRAIPNEHFWRLITFSCRTLPSYGDIQWDIVIVIFIYAYIFICIYVDRYTHTDTYFLVLQVYGLYFGALSLNTSPWNLPCLGRLNRLELMDPSADALVVGDANLTFSILLAKHREATGCEEMSKVQTLWIYKFSKQQMDVSKNRGTPKWMVYKGKPY